MSEQKQDARLAELMNEFLENKEEKPKENGFDKPGLDNKKMLDAIEGHRSEIKALQLELAEVKNSLKEQATTVKTQIVDAPEITALESKISKHNSQIGDLVYQQKMLKTDIEQEKKRKKSKGGFGAMGWLLLVSNILLWSLIAFFFYSNTSPNKKITKSKSQTNRENISKNKGTGSASVSEVASTDSVKVNNMGVRVDTGVADVAENVNELPNEPIKVNEAIVDASMNAKKVNASEKKKELAIEKRPVESKTTSVVKNKVANNSAVKVAKKSVVKPIKKVEKVVKKTRAVPAKREVVSTKKTEGRVRSQTSQPNRSVEKDSEPDVTFGD
jgi:hypothetical protein